jgi:serine/threonine protein kinase
MSPEFLGPYKIENIIGQGGMGTVFKAVHVKSGDLVAVKVISNSIAEEPRFRRRFHAEIETLKRLKHPNIVQLIGYGEEGGKLFYSMEYVDGESLHDCVKKNGPIPWEEVLRIGIDVCSGLKHAHDMGIVHRDLKPANLLINENGTVKLVDFGIAKLFGAAEMTMAGSIVGTADYMAPEQADGKVATTRSDLYSLGSVLYSSISGRAPFGGKTVPETLYALKFTDPIPLRRLIPDTPVEFAELIEQLLSKDPANRPPTALVVTNRMKAMQQGLKKRSETIEIEEIGTQETHTSLDLAEFKERLIDLPTGTSDRITLEAKEVKVAQPTDPTILARPQTKLEPANHGESCELHESAADSSNTSHVTNGGTHFTTVDHDKERNSSGFSLSSDSGNSLSQVISVALISIALVTCIVALWFLTRSPTADELYANFSSAIDSGNVESLSAEYDSLVSFQERFPNDERTDSVRIAITEVDAARRLRGLLRRSRRDSDSFGNSTMEASIVEGLRVAESDPDRGLRMLKAIMDVYSVDKSLTPDKKELLQIVERKRDELASQISDRNSGSQKDLSEKLSWGDANLKGEQRLNFLKGVIELYADKAWAATDVDRARKLLSESAQP